MTEERGPNRETVGRDEPANGGARGELGASAPTNSRDSTAQAKSASKIRPQRPLWQRFVLWGAGLLVVGGLAGLLAVVLVVRHFSKDLPDVRQLQDGYSPPQVTRVLARDDTLLANLFLERRTVVPVEKVPDHVKSAFLAAEDAGFFEHEGLDFLGLVRAMVANVRAGHVKQGGSTITQQVVKNVLLDHERSYRRKIRETILAYHLEKTLTKSQILGMYINHIYLGHGRYGVEEAGRFYFGKHVDELDVAEAALLAGIVAAPERYSPRRDQDKALARRKYVLGQMLDKGFMTQHVYDGSLIAPIRLAPAAEAESDIAPEMVGHAQRLLREVVGERARKGGFIVRTTIDPELQIAARLAVRQGLDDYLKRQRLKAPFTLQKRQLWGKAFEGTPRQHGIYVGNVVERNDRAGTISVRVGDTVGVVRLKDEERFNPTHVPPTEFVGPDAALRVRILDEPEDASPEAPVRLRLELGPQAALLALDPSTSEVLAAVGSYEALAGGLDRTIQTKRQPGSTFKPLVYSYALDTHQVTAASFFEFPLTEQERAKLSKAASDAVLEEGASVPEVPQTTRISLRAGIAHSDNRVAGEVFRMVGGRQAVQWAQTLGIESQLGADASLMLGAYETTVAEMAGAYSVFASGGTAIAPLFVRSIESGEGPVTLPARAPARRVMDPAVAHLMTSLLESVVQEGTGKLARSLGRPLAGKTGTTNRAKDAWFVGYSTDLVVAVWVGYDDALPLGWGESGASAALPIWMEFMQAAHKGKSATQFPRPAEIEEVQIDPATGLLARYGQENAIPEIFLKGTEPTETAPELGDAPPPGEPSAPTEDEPEDAVPEDRAPVHLPTDDGHTDEAPRDGGSTDLDPADTVVPPPPPAPPF